MNWIDKELKRRAAAAVPPDHADQPPGPSDAERMATLWETIVRANEALPGELQLPLENDPPRSPMPDAPRFLAWLRAPNGAALGFTGDAIRYVWPGRGRRRSNNFWVRWGAESEAYRVHQRIGSTLGSPRYAERRFDERRVEHVLRCLVTGRRIRPRSLRHRRFWLF